MPAELIRGAARLYATGGNGAIYYGLGVTEHSQGSTTVMAIANLAMATGNIGRPGVGVNPLRGQNNVQGACDMGSFPHELPGYRHISDDATREIYESLWGVTLDHEPGLRIPNMLDAAVDGTFKGIYIQGEDILQSDPNTKHVAAGLAAMECVVVHDLFLNETANYAHVFLPGSTFLEKDGTFTNAERRINRVRKVMAPKNGYADWEVTQKLAQAMGIDWNYTHPSEIMDEIAATTPSFAGVSYRPARRDGLGAVAVQREGAAKARRSCTSAASCAARASSSAPNMWRPTRRPGRASRCCSPPAASSVAVQCRRADAAHRERRLARGGPAGDPPARCREARHARRRLGAAASRAGETTLRALITDRVAPGVVYTTFHHPETQANVITTDYLRLGDQLPGIQGDGRAGRAVQRADASGRTNMTSRPATAAGSRPAARRRNSACRASDARRRSRGLARGGSDAAADAHGAGGDAGGASPMPAPPMR